MSTRTFLVIVRPEQINGRLAAHGGKLLLNLLNYSELLTEMPVVKDDALQVFEVEVDEEQVRVQQEGPRELHLLWAGEKHARSRPGDLVTVQVRSLVEASGQLDPVAAAGQVFSNFPPKVQLGAAILNVDDAAIAAAGLVPAAARKWAQEQVSQLA